VTLPLPDLRALVAESEWIAGRDGLPEAAAVWERELPRVRRALAAEGAALARPRLWVDTVSSLATTGWKMASAAAPDAPLQILSAAASVFGLSVAPAERSAATIRRAEKVVRAGGPAYVKLGQFIATSEGLLPHEWVEAFQWCRDRVPPMEAGRAEVIVRRELGERADELIAFESEPFAAASIGQVHRARLVDGTEVVVKVQREGLRARFSSDIESLALVAAAAHRLHPAVRMANLPGFLELFAQLALEELDFRLEALNMVELSAVFEDAGLGWCGFPRPIPGLVTERVLVMELVKGVPYAQAADEYGTALEGERLLRLAIQGVLEATLMYGLFHGDLHAGNVLIEDGDRFSLVDFGICARVTAEERVALIRFMLAFASLDPGGMLGALEPFEVMGPAVDQAALIAELQVEIDALPMDLSYDILGSVLGGVMRVLAAHGVQLPKEVVLFFKNLLYLGGFSAAVAPGSDLLSHIEPLLMYFTEKYPEEIRTVRQIPIA